MLIAHITDSHVMPDSMRPAGAFDTAQAFDRLVDSILAQPIQPDVVVFSGDLVDRGTVEEYQHLGKALSRLSIPVRAVPGNHDARDTLRAILPDWVGSEAADHLCLVDETFPLTLVGVDTTVPQKPHGVLCDLRLAWLEETLNRLRNKPVLMFMHHPPITTGLWAMDGMGLLEGRERLEQMVRNHGAVQAILCGHMHRSIQGTLGGTPVRVIPSPSHQIAFDLRTGEPYRLVAEPGQYGFHHWHADQGLVSHTVFVE